MRSILHRIFLAGAAVCAVFAMLAVAAPARAAEEAKNYGVLPFTINGPDKYQYLSDGIQAMLISRLHWKEHFQPVEKSALKDMAVPARELAASALDAKGLAYLVYGSLTVMGDECSLDVEVMNRQGEIWPKVVQAKLAALIPSLEGVARSVSAEVFGKPGAAPIVEASREEKPQVLQAMNPALVQNEANAKTQVYLNPEFRYEGASEETGRLHSQRLNMAANSMVVGDLDGDGSTEVVLIDDHDVSVYSFRDSRLDPKSTFEARRSLLNVRLSLIDANRDGFQEIVVCAVNESDNAPASYVLNYRGGKLQLMDDHIPYYLAVVRLAPDYMPTLVGQENTIHGLLKGKVHEVVRMGGQYQLGKRLLLPEYANAFNFAYLPVKEDAKVVLADDDHLKVYTLMGDLQFKSDEVFSGSALGLYYYDVMAGMSKSEGDMEQAYYVPMRCLPVDLDRDGKWELLVNKPISVAAQYFERYRHYPQGEIHALYWDGVGLNLLWKTRRIKGSVVDFAVADVDDDGVQDLVVCLNTVNSALGLSNRKTMVLAYPLDIQEKGGPADEKK
ncbi:MAG: FG-GAP-like repeat-containing protein [Desulfovibrionaceae bacterium]